MGTWGAGNFENDGALDYAGNMGDQLTQTINEVLADEIRSLLDEDGEAKLMPSVALLNLLPCAPPRPQEVETWKTRYLTIFDEQIDYMEPAEGYKAERRQVIVATFDTLLQKSQDMWGNDSG